MWVNASNLGKCACSSRFQSTRFSSAADRGSGWAFSGRSKRGRPARTLHVTGPKVGSGQVQQSSDKPPSYIILLRRGHYRPAARDSACVGLRCLSSGRTLSGEPSAEKSRNRTNCTDGDKNCGAPRRKPTSKTVSLS